MRKRGCGESKSEFVRSIDMLWSGTQDTEQVLLTDKKCVVINILFQEYCKPSINTVGVLSRKPNVSRHYRNYAMRLSLQNKHRNLSTRFCFSSRIELVGFGLLARKYESRSGTENPELFHGFMQSPKQASIACSWSTPNQAETDIRRVFTNSGFTAHVWLHDMSRQLLAQYFQNTFVLKFLKYGARWVPKLLQRNTYYSLKLRLIYSSYVSALQWSKSKLEDDIKCVLYKWGVEMWDGLHCYKTESSTNCC
jgi:predicted ribonuclease YlaK